MSIELATAYVNLVPSTRGFGKSLVGQTGSAAQSAGDSAGKRFGSGFVATAGKLVAGVLAVKGIAKGFQFAKGAVFDFNSQLEQADIGFSTMLGSGQKSKAFLDQLQGFAKKTPFEFEGLVQNSQTLLGMGIAAKDIIPTLTALGDSTASVGGNADKLNQTILAFAQTAAKGTLDMGNMNQLLQGGVPNALKILAAKYNVTTGAMVKMISAGKVQSSEALPLLVQGIEKGTKATAALGGMMDKQSQTMAGALGNIGDSATQLIAGAFKPLFSVTSSGLQGFADALGSDKVQKWADRTAAGITRAITVTKGAIEVIRTGDFNPKNWPGFEEDSPVVGFFFHIRDAVKVATGAIEVLRTGNYNPKNWPGFEEDSPVVGFFFDLRDAMGRVVKAAGPLQAKLSKSWAQAPKGMVVGWSDILVSGTNTAIGAAVGAVRKQSPGFRKYLGDLFSLPPEAAESWQSFASVGLGKAKDAAISFGRDAWGGIKNFLDAARPGFEKLWGAIQPLIQELGPSLKTILPLLNPFKFLFDALRPMLPQIGQVLGQIASTIGGFLASALKSAQPLLEAVVAAVGKLMPFVQKLVSALLPPLMDLFKKLSPLLDSIFKALEPVIDAIAKALIPIIEALEPVVERVFSFIGDTIKNVMKVFSGIIDFITGIFSGNWSKAWNGIKEIFGGFFDQIKNVGKLLLDWFGNVPGWIWDKIKAFSGWLFDRGAALLNWIWNGIKSAAGAVWRWFAGIGDRIWNGIKTAGAAIIGFGGRIIGWIGEGIKNGVSAVWDWITDIPAKLWSGLSAIASDLWNFGGSLMDKITGGMISTLQKGLDESGFKNAIKTGGFNNGSAGGVPMAARAGGGMLPNGYSIINELGPELLYKQGANVKVMTAGQTQQVTAGRDAPLIGQVMITERMDPWQLAAELDRRQAFLARV